MDNLENIILFVLIIFSIFSSIMKKKKKADVKAKKGSPQAPKKQSIVDVFKEIANEALPKEEPHSEVDAFFLEAQKEVRKLSAIDKTERAQETMAAKSFSHFQKPTLIKPNETRFDLTYDNVENELNLKNQNLHNIRKLMSKPNSLREYILMKEILDKPKALQDI